MKPESIRIYENINLHYHYTEKFKTSQLSLYFVAPLQSPYATAHRALLFNVLRRGSCAFPTQRELGIRLEELYSADFSTSVFKRGDLQILHIGIATLRREFTKDGEDLLPGAAELLSELLLRPLTDRNTGVFLSEYVESEKKNAIDRIRAQMNNKSYYARCRCVSHMCDGEVYGISEYGTPEDIEKITPASLYGAYRALLSEATVEAFYTGSAPVDTVREALAGIFADINRHPIRLPPPEPNPSARRVRRVKETTVAKQGKLCIGFRSSLRMEDPSRNAVLFFLCVFGVSPTSKLFVNVREKLSLCYSCSATNESSKGIMLVTAGIENRNFRRTVREIFRQFRAMRRGKITEREIDLSRRILINQFLSVEDDPVLLERWYLYRTLSGVTETPEEAIAALEKVTVRDLRAVALTYRPDTVYFLRGDAAGIAEDKQDA